MSLLVPVNTALSALDPELVSGQVMTLKLSLELKSGDRTRISLLVGMLGGIGLVLAVVGLYGIVAYVTAHRTKEIGIRMALGAQVHSAVWVVLRQGLIIVLVGVALGLLASLAFARVIGSMLYGVSPLDATALLGGAILLMAAALLACYVPAHRAARIDPMSALRVE